MERPPGDVRIVVLMDQARPHEAMMLALSAFYGIMLEFRHGRGSQLTEHLSHNTIHLFAITLAAFGLVGVMSLTLRKLRPRRVGSVMRLEVGALLGSSGSLIVFTVATIRSAGWSGVFVYAYACAIIIAHMWRTRQLIHNIKSM